MTIKFDFEFAADQLVDDLNAFMAATGREGETDVRRLGEIAKDRMRDYCPVDTGRLKASIDAREGRDNRGFFVDVGSFDVEYNAYVEYGTSRMAAQPYVRPGLAEAIVLWVREGD